MLLLSAIDVQFTWEQCFKALFVDLYDGYNTKERTLQHRLLTIDVVGLLFAAFFLLNLMRSLSPIITKPLPNPPRPTVVLVASTLYAVLTVFVLYEHIAVCPFPTEDTPEVMGVTQRIGRWIYLTRHVLTMQAVHAVCSCLADWGIWQEMAIPTHATSILVSGLGLFVFIQFFVLVYADPDFVSMCLDWHAKGIPIQFLQAWMHIPCGIMALLDVVLIKDRRLLKEVTAPLPTLASYYVVYCALYIALLHANYRGTGYWPYGFMKQLGPWGWRWVGFAAVQTAILNGFLGATWATAMFLPELW
jgi:hypothetical protein